MSTPEVVEAQPRPDTSRGKNEARRLRAKGRIPGVVYGAKKNTVAVTVDPKQISRILQSQSGHNTIFDLQVDLKRIAMDEKIRVTVPIHLTGEAEGVKTQGGILDQVLREVEIECLPADIPTHFDADVSALVFGTVLRVSDLPHSVKVKF